MPRLPTTVGERRRRWAVCGVFALALSITSGCGFVVEADPAPFLSMTPTCSVSGLDASAPVVHEVRITAVHEVEVKGGQVESSVPISDGPEEPRITWTELKMATVDEVLRWIPAEVKRQFSTGKSPGRKQVSAHVSRIGTDDGKFIGYAAIRPVEVKFTGTCADGGTISGYLIAWTGPDVGVVKCGAVLGAGTSAGGRLAQSELC